MYLDNGLAMGGMLPENAAPDQSRDEDWLSVPRTESRPGRSSMDRARSALRSRRATAPLRQPADAGARPATSSRPPRRTRNPQPRARERLLAATIRGADRPRLSNSLTTKEVSTCAGFSNGGAGRITTAPRPIVVIAATAHVL